MESKFHVYLLLDPLITAEHWQDRVFYVGKGSGPRALQHALEFGETDKVTRIEDIRAKGKSYEVLYATWTYGDGTTSMLMSEKEAFLTEATLIQALRPQLTNKASGHNLGFTTASSLQTLNNAKVAELSSDVNALLVCVKGVRGGTDVLNSFVSPDPESAWENAKGWWVFGRSIQQSLATLLAAHKPVVLIALAPSPQRHANIVTGVYQIDSFSVEPSPFEKNGRPKVVFERKASDIEDAVASATRKKLVGNTLSANNLPMVLSQRRITNQQLQALGLCRFKKAIGPGFEN